MRRCLVVLAVLGLLAPATAGAARITVTGGTATALEICGAHHRVQLLDEDATAKVRVKGRRRPVVQQCVEGKWGRRQPLGRHGGPFTAHVGDFRVRARKAKARFVRFGVGEIVDAPLTVTVKNVNRTAVPCTSDGGDRVLHGHLTAPRSVLDQGAPAVTLYLHGFAVSETFWRFRAVPGYDTTMQLAEAGHASVTIDRAGYVSSRSAADGTTTCIGSQVDMAHQVVDALKAGKYDAQGTAPVAFTRAALIGHSAAGAIAELAGASFPGIDGIGIVSYSDQGQSPLTLTELGSQNVRCGTGGDPGTPGFALFGQTDSAFQAAFLNAPTDPAVVAAATAGHVPEPCGDVLSAAQAVVVANAIGPSLQVPVLLLSGADDALFLPAGVQLQAAKYAADPEPVTTEIVPDTGHAITLGKSAPSVVDALESWLTTNNF